MEINKDHWSNEELEDSFWERLESNVDSFEEEERNILSEVSYKNNEEDEDISWDDLGPGYGEDS